MHKNSRQRASIQRYLHTHRTHPTAETVYQDIRQEFPNISLGTVYRNLNLLADLGEILRISPGNGPDRYDANVCPHYHFICENCGNVLDVEMEAQLWLNDAANKFIEGSVTNHVTHFYGLCPECQNKKTQ